MNDLKQCILFMVCAGIFFLGCSRGNVQVIELRHYPVKNLEGVIDKPDVEVDREISSDGNGSLRITATGPVTVQLYETGDLNIENAMLIYKARIRTRDVRGQVFLEMWCHFPDKGEFFSRALHAPLSGNNEWTAQETPFMLKKGENPDNVKLNLVINGKGTAWIDDIRLVKGPLR